ncbi:MAG TPA: putative toxin-antitoxin system toxin component, PIN family [Phycisphaerae bacterium]|nr:putative toxin-antitoxin system toxin component, PIN family [Phycisphaerae bacterium]
MSGQRPVVVYDCNVLLQAALSDAGPSFACLLLAEKDRVQLVVSTFIAEEIRDVLSRPRILQKNPQVTPERVAAYLELLASKSRFVEEIPQKFSLPRDPKDEPYVNLAIAVNARYLVTWNEKHLTYLMEGKTPESIDFLARYPDLAITTPPVFLQAIRSA